MCTPVVVDHVVKDVLGVTLKRPERGTSGTTPTESNEQRFYVGQFYTRITGLSSTDEITLDTPAIDDVVRATVFACILHNRNPLIILSEAFCRCSHAISNVESGKNPFKSTAVSTDEKLSNDQQCDLKQLLTLLGENIVRTSALIISCPAFFDLETLVDKKDLKRPPLDVLNDDVRCNMVIEVSSVSKNSLFVQKLIDAIWLNDDSGATVELFRLFTRLEHNATNKVIGEKPLAELNALTSITVSNIGAKLFLNWISDFQGIDNKRKTSGVQRDVLSLWGRILSTQPLNEEAIYAAPNFHTTPSVHEKALNARKIHFHGKKNITAIRNSLASIRQDHEHYIDLLANFLKQVLRKDFNTRKDLLLIFGKLIGLNTAMRHISRVTHVEQPPLSIDDNFKRRRQFMQDSTFGTSLNIMWLMLVLAAGITDRKVDSIDPYFCQIGFYAKHKMSSSDDSYTEDEKSILKEIDEMRNVVDNMLGFVSSGNAAMGDEAQLLEALEKHQFDLKATFNANFITQIFWSNIHALGMLYLPCIQELLKLTLFTLQEASSSPDAMNESVYEVLSHVFTWKCVVQNSKFIEVVWHFLNISLQFFLRCALYTKWENTQSEAQKKLEGPSLYIHIVNQYVAGNMGESEEMTAEFIVLPVEFIDTILDVIKQVFMMHYYMDHIKPADVNLLQFMNFELLIATCIFIMRAPQMAIKNLTLKCETVSSIVLHMCRTGDLANFASSKTATIHLVDALTNIFIASQKADYNSRVSCRLNIIQILTKLFEIEAYRNSFVKQISSNKEIFVQFMHLLINDTTFIFEEVVTYLSEIRRRELSGTTEEAHDRPTESSDNASQNPEYQNQHRQDNEYEVDPSLQDGNVDANQLRGMNFNDLKRRTRSLVEYGWEITNLFNILCREFPTEITNMSVLLPQVASCLGCCLDNLAGESCTRLKVKNMMEYQFKPKEWLTNIVNCYLSLYRGENASDSERFIKAIVSEGRYYKPNTFERAYRIITREMLLPSKDRRDFFNMSQKMCMFAKANSTLYESAMEAEIPEEFIDPIMNDIMEDPVLLPTSGVIMDRKNIERHLMSESTDPFSRQPLAKSDLVPQVDLKRRIDVFMESISQKRDIGDDFYQN